MDIDLLRCEKFNDFTKLILIVDNIRNKTFLIWSCNVVLLKIFIFEDFLPNLFKKEYNGNIASLFYYLLSKNVNKKDKCMVITFLLNYYNHELKKNSLSKNDLYKIERCIRILGFDIRLFLFNDMLDARILFMIKDNKINLKDIR